MSATNLLLPLLDFKKRHSPAVATAVLQVRQRMAVRHFSLLALFLGVAEVRGRTTRHARLCNKTVRFLHRRVTHDILSETLVGHPDNINMTLWPQKNFSDRPLHSYLICFPLLIFHSNRRPILFIRILAVITT